MAVWVNIFYISLSLCITRVVSQFQLQPVNVTVLKGSDAQINATLPTGWQSVAWTVDETLVLVFNPSGNSTAASNRYSASFCITDNTECVQFIIRNVTRNDKVVECNVLGIQGSQTARLDVQESGTVNIRGGDVAVERGQQVKFQCDTSAWFPEPDVGWTLNGVAVDSISYNTTSIAVGDFYNSTSVLNFHAVSNATVECRATVAALKNPISSSVFLTVEPPGWTVSFCLALLVGLLTLVVLLIFCCTRRKERRSQMEIDYLSSHILQDRVQPHSPSWPRRRRRTQPVTPPGFLLPPSGPVYAAPMPIHPPSFYQPVTFTGTGGVANYLPGNI